MTRGPTVARSLLAAGALLLAATACSSARAVELLEISPTPRTLDRQCGISEGPERPDLVLDSAMVSQRVAKLALHDGALLLSIVPAEDSLPGGHRLGTTFSAQEADRLEGVLMEGLRPERERGRLLVEVVGGRVARLETGAYSWCRPVLADRRAVQKRLAAVAERYGTGHSARLKMRVDTAGVVQEVRVEEGTGDPVLDLLLSDVGGSTGFRPATLDGRPREVWIALTYTLESDCGRYTHGQQLRLPDTHACAR